MNWWLAAWFLWPINCSTCSTCPACPGTALLTIPLWVFLGNKTSKRHIYLVGAILSCDRSSLLRCFFVDKPVILGGGRGSFDKGYWQECFQSQNVHHVHHFLAAVDFDKTCSATRNIILFCIEASPFFENQQTFLYVRGTTSKTYISQKIINGWFKYSLWNDPTFLGETFPIN